MATGRCSPHAARTLRRPRSPSYEPAPGWVRSREQGWVYSGERRSAFGCDAPRRSARGAHVLLQRPAELARASLLGQEVLLDEALRQRVAPLHDLDVELQGVVLSLFEDRDRGAIAEDVRARLHDLGEGAP